MEGFEKVSDLSVAVCDINGNHHRDDEYEPMTLKDVVSERDYDHVFRRKFDDDTYHANKPLKIPPFESAVEEFVLDNLEFVKQHMKFYHGSYAMDDHYVNLCFDSDENMYFINDRPITFGPTVLQRLSYKDNFVMVLRRLLTPANAKTLTISEATRYFVADYQTKQKQRSYLFLMSQPEEKRRSFLMNTCGLDSKMADETIAQAKLAFNGMFS
jgi:hypothetical protein